MFETWDLDELASGSLGLLFTVGFRLLSGIVLLGAVLMRPLAFALPASVGTPPESARMLDILGWLYPVTMVVFYDADDFKIFGYKSE